MEKHAMIIDMHTHTFPNKIAAAAVDKLRRASHTASFSDGTAAGLSARRREAGFDLSVILPVATAAKQVEHINDASARINETTKETGLLALGCIHPDYPDYAQELSRMQRMGLKGLKVHPVYQRADLDDVRFLRIFHRAAELGLFVVTHAGYDIGYPGVVHCSPAMARNVKREIPELTLVLAHMGGWQCWDEAEAILPETGVYLDTSFSTGTLTPLEGDAYWMEHSVRQLDADRFTRMVRTFGVDRILFGTDSPWMDLKTVLADFLAMPLTEAEKKAILGENARRLLNLT